MLQVGANGPRRVEGDATERKRTGEHEAPVAALLRSIKTTTGTFQWYCVAPINLQHALDPLMQEAPPGAGNLQSLSKITII